MKTKYTEEQLEQMTDRYASWVITGSCDAPITEVGWLVEQLLNSEHREDIIDLLKMFED